MWNDRPEVQRVAPAREATERMKVDLHIHTLDDPKDAIDYSAQQLLEKARALGFGVLAITLHDCVFQRREVFEQAEAMGILLLSAAEMRIEGADIVLLNITPEEAAGLRSFDHVRRLRARRGQTIFTFAPHPFYFLGASIGGRLLKANIDCFDAIEICHFHKGWFDRNRPARRVAERFGKILVATSDAHELRAFGSHYTLLPRPAEMTPENVFAALRAGTGELVSPPASWRDILSTLFFLFVVHPWRRRRRGCRHTPLPREPALEPRP